jgi:hypothetical protein
MLDSTICKEQSALEEILNVTIMTIACKGHSLCFVTSIGKNISTLYFFGGVILDVTSVLRTDSFFDSAVRVRE